MPILNYTTSVDYDKTISEIQVILVKHGAVKITTDYLDKLPSSVTFCLPMNGTLVAFALPANYEGVLSAMKRDRKIKNSYVNKEQALRVSWRIVKDWVAAQMAIVDSELADMAEVFLPYAITKSGTTLYKELSSGNNFLLNSGS